MLKKLLHAILELHTSDLRFCDSQTQLTRKDSILWGASLLGPL